MANVFVVTHVEAGWDCVIGVYSADSVDEDDLEKAYSQDDGYFIHYQETLHSV